MGTALFHIPLLALVFLGLKRAPSGPRHAILRVTAIVIGGGLLVAFLGDSHLFGIMRRLAYLLFLYLPLGLMVSAVVLLRDHPKLRRLFGGGALVLVMIALWAFLIEPRLLQVNTTTLHSTELTRPLKITVVSDLQTDHVGAYERRVLEAVKSTEADLILLTGDYLQVRRRKMPPLIVELNALLREIDLEAPLGVYAVRGDTELDGWPTIFEGTQIEAIETTTQLQLPDLTLSALSAVDSRFGPDSLDPASGFHVVFGHAPDYALKNLDADLQIAGHTHGGQVRVPLIGPLVTFSWVPRAWADGVTDLGDGRTLVVSRGIGMERGNAPRLRFLCPPEIVVLEILP